MSEVTIRRTREPAMRQRCSASSTRDPRRRTLDDEAAGRGGGDGLRQRLELHPSDPESGRRRTVWALVVDLALRPASCHLVWPTTSQGKLDGHVVEVRLTRRHWAFFRGRAPLTSSSTTSPAAREPGPTRCTRGCTRGFLEYARHRGFITDPARVRH